MMTMTMMMKLSVVELIQQKNTTQSTAQKYDPTANRIVQLSKQQHKSAQHHHSLPTRNN
jgi:hypothetical protein